MKLSVFTTIKNPERRGDNVSDALACYKDLADEVVVIDGNGKMPDGTEVFEDSGNKYISHEWPQDFSWEFIGQQFQRGYEAATGDWVIHADLDFIFHEKDFERIRQELRAHPDAPALSFYKHQFILPDRYNLKSRLVIAVNKGVYGDRIRFDSGGDLCQPSLDGKEIKPDDVPESRIPFYNYERLTKRADQIFDDASRMEAAYKRRFGRALYAYDGHSAYQGLINMMCGRFNKPQQNITLKEHPKYVQKTIRNLEPDQWGYSGFGLLPHNSYVKGAGDD